VPRIERMVPSPSLLLSFGAAAENDDERHTPPPPPDKTSFAGGMQQVYNPYLDDTTKTSAQSILLVNPQDIPTSFDHTTSSSPRILSLFVCIYQSIIKFLQWYIDNWITGLARLNPLPTNYSDPQTYSLRFTTDNILGTFSKRCCQSVGRCHGL